MGGCYLGKSSQIEPPNTLVFVEVEYFFEHSEDQSGKSFSCLGLILDD